MTEPKQEVVQTKADGRPGQVYRAGAAIACLLLASAGICWVAANWDQASKLQKLAGVQVLMVVLVLLAAWFMWAGGHALSPKARRSVQANRNFMPWSHLAGLAGVATGGLLALIGQIYQTGADAWQLFLTWAVLLIPWVFTLHTVFLGLLFVAVLNTSWALYMGMHGDGGWWGMGSWPISALLAALFNGALLAAWERFIGRFDDSWRVGPRVLATVVAAWLIVAAFAALDSTAGPIGMSLTGWAALAVMYVAYTRLRADLAIVTLAALAAFVLLVLPLLYWVGSEAGLLLVVVLLLIAMVIGLRKLAGLLRARAIATDPWYISAFRLVAMGITAVLLIVFLLLILDFEADVLWVPGLLLCLSGALVYRLVKTDILHELGLTLMTAGLLLAGGSFFNLHEDGMTSVVYALLVLGIGLYVLARNAAFRFIDAFFVLGMVTVMTWPLGDWEDALLVSGNPAGFPPFSVYLRVWWFSIAAALALVLGRGEQAGKRWRPLAWALAFLAQIIVWHIPAPSLGLVAEAWRHQPSIVIVWLACAALPVVALAAVLWRKPATRLMLRVGAPLALAVATVGWMGAPGVSLALLWLIIGFALMHRSLMVFGVLALLAYLARFYYQLDTTLLHKSFVLGATGAWLLAWAWGLARASRVGTVASGSFSASERPAIRPHSPVWQLGGLVAGVLMVLAVANTGIYQREKILSAGQRVVLALAPVDPRSLIQGDYMRLRFEVADEVRTALEQVPGPVRQEIESSQDGLLVLRPDSSGVHRLQEVLPGGGKLMETGLVADDDSRATLQDGDVLLAFRLRDGRAHVVTDAWFFTEGQAHHFEQARYGEFRVDNDGTGLLVNMLDEKQQPLAQR